MQCVGVPRDQGVSHRAASRSAAAPQYDTARTALSRQAPPLGPRVAATHHIW
jgi:hypothetical protein